MSGRGRGGAKGKEVVPGSRAYEKLKSQGKRSGGGRGGRGGGARGEFREDWEDQERPKTVDDESSSEEEDSEEEDSEDEQTSKTTKKMSKATLESSEEEDSEEEDSDEEETTKKPREKKGKGVEGIIEIENPNRVKEKNLKAADVAKMIKEGNISNQSSLSRKEKEALDAQKNQSKSAERKDLARLAEVKKRREEAAARRDEELKAKEQKEKAAREGRR
ncbi:putative phosphoprotein/coiled-coil protein [Planoprotostelium fungivorum]|uniref:Putative phosphoprotein/coiled-coil protein n=1 Tax=Planoprotostelium fungivorum TaxID=1890364 RepID=A0A2P6NXZ5_9EUKA|nr:putative phosphoprotein/coiled-coil protein [Planoprotostelium fungivorum]